MASSVQQPWLLLLIVLLPAVAANPIFDENYAPTWGADGYHLVDQGIEVRITMDRNSGAGFGSKLSYGSGFFHMRIKIPGGYTAGVVTAYYLSSDPDSGNHDEVDFEFLGNVDGKPITLQTNVFVNGHGDREQRLGLWFDPAADFHDYRILWNPYQLVVFVDEVPIRVMRNMTGRVPEYEFPAKRMRLRASMWDGSGWATDGGRTKIDWNRAPFTAAFRGFGVDACANTSATPCGSPDLWWNARRYRRLSAQQRAAYENVKNTYMNYDYCTDKDRFANGNVPPECSYD
ncbi:putative xyloglucan endotransglucosylase/hydrolase protein 1 [Lolium rigidum]|uniref:putative xyloglucan endotransglucosylase/hydrolase protein 1 n=1 Tax=Lolium rigidum TaxID=89674 RepID=UPI001F5C9D58|nr:putative xyloglucan endotransglucosylase/hydrolase protein 1 [Lolium rigidum]XP_047096022.1 putative xyloglucan endotransglucosylase/hydrolase protein 1 [Lolium rigidum]